MSKKPVKFSKAIQAIHDSLISWHNKGLEVFEPKSKLDPGPLTPRNVLLNYCRYLAYNNYIIWHWEDIARCGDDEKVVQAKRAIDPHNQQRNNTIENIDEYYIKYQVGDGPYNSETLGSILDRVSINVLKILHIREYPEKAKDRVPVLNQQIKILAECGKILLKDMRKGRRRMINYKQLKMYNDAETNPLFGKKDA